SLIEAPRGGKENGVPAGRWLLLGRRCQPGAGQPHGRSANWAFLRPMLSQDFSIDRVLASACQPAPGYFVDRAPTDTVESFHEHFAIGAAGSDSSRTRATLPGRPPGRSRSRLSQARWLGDGAREP